MKTVGAIDAQTHLPRLLDEVERGEVIVISSASVGFRPLTQSTI